MKPPNPKNIAAANALQETLTSLLDETDRGSVVLAVAWLDEALSKVINKALVPTPNNKELLLKPGQPIGDMGTKIILAYRLGLIPKNLVESLNLCRKLRNDFAHIASNLSFSTPSIIDRVSVLFQQNEDLITTMGNVLIDSNTYIHLNNPEGITIKNMLKEFGTKRLFQFTCGFLCAALAMLECETTQLTERVAPTQLQL
ncbi:hypothetical protein [Pseudomonas sp. Irchel 3H9]|uniref:hypothetical protein n=1 Tax=Pseudomonas sp. Irchel 3H9 TaxID=2009043 RepID=UPI00117999E8|nr:hypothetical protein [Pseudomonas sp. Irchel 3H9]